MAGDFENLAQTLLRNVSGGQNAGDTEKYMGLLQSPEGRKLLENIPDSEKEGLARDGAAAMQGDSAALRRAMLRLMSSKEGASLMKQAMDIHNGKR